MKRREKNGGKKWGGEETLVRPLQGALSFGNERERGERERRRRGDSSEWFILILFLLYPAMRRWRFIDFSLRRSPWCSSVITNVTCPVFVLVFAFYGATRNVFDDNTREISLSVLWQKSFHSETAKSIPSLTFWAKCVPWKTKIREIREFKRNSMAIDKRPLIEFFVDKLLLCQCEHIPIWAHSNFDLSWPGFFSRGMCWNNYFAVANSIFLSYGDIFSMSTACKIRATGSLYFKYIGFVGDAENYPFNQGQWFSIISGKWWVLFSVYWLLNEPSHRII